LNFAVGEILHRYATASHYGKKQQKAMNPWPKCVRKNVEKFMKDSKRFMKTLNFDIEAAL